jgi:MFS family permease
VKDPTEPSDTPSQEAADPIAEPVRAKRPWWLPHFLGRVPVGLEAKYVSLVGIVALSGFFESYDLSVVSAAMKQIRESFLLNQAEMTSLLGWIRLGAIPAFLILPLADRVGRRRVFLVAVIGMSVATMVTGFALTPMQFVIAQTVARTFIVATIATAVVIIAEELPAEHRGWGIGMFGAIGAFGYGLGALLYAFVDVLPYGWRFLYVMGGLPLLLMPLLRRRVPETSRFLKQRDDQVDAVEQPGFMQPMLELLREYPARSLAVAGIALSFAIGAGPAFGLLSDFVQTTHEWKPSSYSMMAIIAGMVGIIGNPAMGWAADRVGRRPITMLAFGLYPIAAFAIYFGPGEMVPLFWMPFVFILTGASALMRIISSELFPTSSRNTALGWETLCETLGGAIGFGLVGGFTSAGTSIAPAVVAVSAFTLLGVAVVWLLPETAGLELEATSQTADEAAHG